VSDGDNETPKPDEKPASPLTRRAALKVLGVAPIAGALAWQQQQQGTQQKPRQTHEAPNQPAADTKQPPRAARQGRFFTARETRTVRVLADDIIPRDARSGSASEAGVVAFLDFNLAEPETGEATRTAWRGGLRWLDAESRSRFGVPYATAKGAQRHQILEDIAWVDRVRPDLRHGAVFFARARDMIAAGFFSSAMGYRDLQYQGNTFVPKWTGCPEAALQKLGVSYDLMKKADAR
jgi:hypothetical protein